LIFHGWPVGWTELILDQLSLGAPIWVHISASLKFLTCFPTWVNKINMVSQQNCKMASVFALPEEMCEININ